MKVLPTIIIVVFTFAFAKAQVGIGTTNPNAALDIRATSNPEESGILIPKLADYPAGVGADQDGMLIYIDGSGATTKGFYYYDHSITTWVPIAGAAAADNQQIDVLNLNGTNLEISLQDDGVATQTLDLSSLQDGTGSDDQTIDTFNFNSGTGILTLELEDDGIPAQTVNLSSLAGSGGTDDQTIDNFSLSGSTLQLSLEDDGQPLQTVNLAGLDTDDQQIDVLNLNGTNLEISLQDDGVATQSVDLSSISGGTLNDAYDFGGAGAGRIINATDGPVSINGNSGLYVSLNNSADNLETVDIRATMDGNSNKGMYISLSGDAGAGNFRSAYAMDNYIRTLINNGTVYGLRNRFVLGSNLNSLLSTGNIGVMNDFYSGTNAGSDIGVSNRFAILSTQRTIGTDNFWSRSSGTAYGLRNSNSSTANGIYYGVSNQFINNSTSDNTYGLYNALSGSSTGNRYGVYTTIPDNVGGIPYGTYVDVRKSTGFAAFLIGRTSLGNDYANRYIMPASDGTAGQVITTDGLGNLSFQTVTTGGTDTDDQQIDVLNLNGTNLEISLQDDGIATQTLDLSSLQDGIGSDDQTIDNFSLSGSTLRLSLEDDGQPLQTVNLAELDSDDQQIDVLNLNGTNLEISLQDDGVATQTLDLSSLQDGTGTDNQTIDNFSLSGSTLRLSLEDDGQPLQTVNLAGLDSDDQQIDVLNLNGTNLEISLQDDGVATQTLDLSSLQDGNTQNTLDAAYDEGGAGNGNTINATDGAVTIAGEDGLLVTGTYNSGETIQVSGAGSRMIFNPRKAAFRAGYVGSSQWDDGNVGALSTAFSGGTASNIYSVAFGSNSIASGERSISIGDGTEASGVSAIGFGINNIASGRFSTVAGVENTANSYAETVVGMFATEVTPSSASNYAANDRLFSIGNGTGSGSLRSNALTIYKSGLMNINDEYNMPLTDGTNGQVMTTDGAGNVTFQSITGEATTASNGLTEATDDIQLGGALTQATTILQGANNFYINLDSTGDFAIQDNGTDVFFVEDSGEIGLGTSTPVHPLHMVETGTYNNGFFMTKIETSSGDTAGIRVEKQGLGTGRSHGLFTVITGTGTGQKYGVFNRISATSAGNQYGTRNFMAGNTTANQFGTFNNLDSDASGDIYGVYNGMRNDGGSNQVRGVHNEFDTNSSVNEMTGVRNQMGNGTPGTGGMNGVYTVFSNGNNGNYYGSRTEFTTAATGTGNKYGSYNFLSSSAGGTHYGTYNNVSANNGWAGYFVGRNYISRRLSIGEEDNPNARMNVTLNSSGTVVQAELEEQDANDGARLKFTNSVETNNHWTLYGRADDTTGDGQFNIFHSVTGNVVRVEGSGNVGITGDPDTDFHVFHGNSGTTSGMKLQNTNDNSWWRLYVSSGSDDLRLFSTSQGTTIIGAFNDITGAYTASSDRRLKQDFQELYFDWENFMKLEPLTYSYKADPDKRSTIGLVAQDVANIYPELVTYHEDGDVYHMDYSATGVVAIKAAQEQQKLIEELQQENKELKNTLEQLMQRVAALEKK